MVEGGFDVSKFLRDLATSLEKQGVGRVPLEDDKNTTPSHDASPYTSSDGLSWEDLPPQLHRYENQKGNSVSMNTATYSFILLADGSAFFDGKPVGETAKKPKIAFDQLPENVKTTIVRNRRGFSTIQQSIGSSVLQISNGRVIYVSPQGWYTE